MSSVRIRKKAPIVYVPVEPNKVVVVPTNDIPKPESPNSPENQDFLQERAEQLASPSTSQSISRPGAPQRLRSRTVIEPAAPRLATPPKRQARSVYESKESLDHGQPKDKAQNERTSWFRDHVLRPRSGTLQTSPRDVRSSVSNDRYSLTGSVPQVNVIIPDEVRSGFAQALAAQESHEHEEGGSISESELHHNDIIEHLDVIDAHISTVSHLSNAANSILVPPLSFYSRKPVIRLPGRRSPKDAEKGESQDELDAHVEDVLSKRANIRRGLQGLWAYLKTPIGVVTGIYGFLVVFWGAAIVLFLLKWINLHDSYKQGFWIEISSQVVNALFTVQGVGFLPWRIMDTYHIMWISHYDRVDQRKRREAKLPTVGDVNDIPDALIDSEHVQVLTDEQVERLRYHQVRFMKSQTWYRPHATETHKAFSIKYAIAICFAVDFNSVFQIMLCSCMWSMNRFQRPAWTIGSLIPLSFLCGIGAGVLIWKGGNDSKKTKEVEERLQQALEKEKQVLSQRFGPEHADTPALVEKPSTSPEKSLVPPSEAEPTPRRSGESKRSPLFKSLNIDEIMSIPEDKEEPTTKSSPTDKPPWDSPTTPNGANGHGKSPS